MELSQAHLRYLLAIGELSQGKAAVSSTQVARVLRVSRPPSPGCWLSWRKRTW